MYYKKTTLTIFDLTIIMSEPKTKPTDVRVEDFLNAVEHPTRKEDGFELLRIMKEITKKNSLCLPVNRKVLLTVLMSSQNTY